MTLDMDPQENVVSFFRIHTIMRLLIQTRSLSFQISFLIWHCVLAQLGHKKYLELDEEHSHIYKFNADFSIFPASLNPFHPYTQINYSFFLPPWVLFSNCSVHIYEHNTISIGLYIKYAFMQFTISVLFGKIYSTSTADTTD